MLSSAVERHRNGGVDADHAPQDAVAPLLQGRQVLYRQRCAGRDRRELEVVRLHTADQVEHRLRRKLMDGVTL